MTVTFVPVDVFVVDKGMSRPFILSPGKMVPAEKESNGFFFVRHADTK